MPHHRKTSISPPWSWPLVGLLALSACEKRPGGDATSPETAAETDAAAATVEAGKDATVTTKDAQVVIADGTFVPGVVVTMREVNQELPVGKIVYLNEAVLLEAKLDGVLLERPQAQLDILVKLIVRKTFDPAAAMVLVIVRSGEPDEERYFIPATALTLTALASGATEVSFWTRELSATYVVVAETGATGASTPPAGFTERPASPPDATDLVAMARSPHEFFVSWRSAGGSTAGFVVAYVEGAAAPSNCVTGHTVLGGGELGTVGSLTFADLGNKSLSVRLCALNNRSPPDRSAGITVSVVKDDIAPGSFTITVPAAVNTAALEVNWSDAGGDDTTYNLSIATSAACTPPFTDATSGIRDRRWVTSPLPDGGHFVCMTAVDRMGNSTPATNTGIQTLVDTVPPGAGFSTLPAALTKESSISATIAVGDVVTYQYAVTANGSCDGVVYSEWRSTSQAIVETVTGDGAKQLCVRGRDAVGNTQPTPLVATWVLDTTPPAAALTAPPPAFSEKSTLTLAVAAGDVTQYRFALRTGGDAASCDGASYGAWVGVATPMTLADVGDDGLKRLCLVGMDLAGNAATIPTSYTWTKTPPNPLGLGVEIPSATQLRLSWTSGGGETANFVIAYASGAVPPPDCATGTVIPSSSVVGTTHTISGLVAHASYGFRVCAVDGRTPPIASPGIVTLAVANNYHELGAGAGQGDGMMATTVAAGGLVLGQGDWLYQLDGGNARINRFALATGAFGGWVGRIATSPSGGDPGCAGAAAGDPTPGWCLGGTAMTGTGDGMLNPADGGIAFAAGTIYVADKGNHRLVKYDATTGIFAGWLGRVQTTPTGGAAGCAATAVGAAVPGWCLGGGAMAGASNGMFNAPGGVAADGSGNLFVADTGNHRVSKFVAASGAFSGWVGRILAAPSGGATGCTLAAAGAITPGWCVGGAAQSGAGAGALSGPASVAVGDDHVFVADTENHRIQRVVAASGAAAGWNGRLASSSGAPINSSGWSDSAGAPASGSSNNAFLRPLGITVAAGKVYVSDSGNHRIACIVTSTGVYEGWRGLIGEAPAGGAVGCATAPAGAVTPGWCLGGTAAAGVGRGALSGPSGYVQSPAGDGYVVDGGNSRILHVHTAE